MNLKSFDYIVIGSGLAGLTFAIEASKHGTVCILTKAELFESNTSYAQGGIAAAVGESDSWEAHERDTLEAGAGLCNKEAVRHLVMQAPNAVAWLEKMGTRFDTDPTQEHGSHLALAREGGHGANRIVHHQDRTGWEIERAMNEAVRKCENISIFENHFVTQLVENQGRVVGVEAVTPEIQRRYFSARAVLVASGGCGRVFQHTTNPRIATGDGVAIAKLAGAKISDMEFMQFHPTTLSHPQLRNFLITEAVRGEGGTLRSHLGDRFMYDYNPQLELAPRDKVARAIFNEMKKLDTWCVYLDMTHLSREHILQHFPTITEKLAKVGIEPHRHWIPIVPAHHYSCGGIETNLVAQSSVPGLYAAGEAARTGVHGANRLASNSLLEAIVFATAASESVQNETEGVWPENQPVSRKCISESDALRIRRSLQQVMTDKVGIIRSTGGLLEAHSKVSSLIEEYSSLPVANYDQYSVETENLLLVAESCITGAINRKENVGLHYNSDLATAT